MSCIGTFRLLLILQTVLTIVLAFLTYYSVEKLPPELQFYLYHYEATDSLSQWLSTLANSSLIAIGVGFAFILMINVIGLWLLQNWARHLYTGLTIIGFLIYALSYNTPTVTTGLQTIGLDILNMLTGATIAIMYLPPLNILFKKKITASH